MDRPQAGVSKPQNTTHLCLLHLLQLDRLVYRGDGSKAKEERAMSLNVRISSTPATANVPVATGRLDVQRQCRRRWRNQRRQPLGNALPDSQRCALGPIRRRHVVAGWPSPGRAVCVIQRRSRLIQTCPLSLRRAYPTVPAVLPSLPGPWPALEPARTTRRRRTISRDRCG